MRATGTDRSLMMTSTPCACFVTKGTTMTTKRYVRGALLILGLFFAGCFGPKHSMTSQQSRMLLEEQIRKTFSGDAALQTVASMEKDPWRLAGNGPFNRAIQLVADRLKRAGFVPEDRAKPGDRLVYRTEKRPMEDGDTTWEPQDASLTIVGQRVPLLEFRKNLNMIAINSYSTPVGGIEAELVSVGRGRAEDLEGKDLAGKIVLVDYPYPPPKFLAEAYKLGVIGVVMYVPSYPMKEAPTNSIQFRYFPLNPGQWVILLSSDAKEELFKAVAVGPVRVRVDIQTRVYHSEEQMIVAEIRGSSAPEERFVSSAHVNEPGANDNASGVGAQLELARTLAQLLKQGKWNPQRTVTFIWGDEFGAIKWYLAQDPKRAKGVKWGISLDMVGETDNFLIEKTADPSAIWTRGDDHHSGWGGDEPLKVEDLLPSFLNDFVLGRCFEQARTNGWKVRANPFEGGSDHVSFIEAGVPAVLFNHYPDTAYHHDNDRLGRVDPVEMTNVGVCAGFVAAILAAPDSAMVQTIIEEVKQAALERLETEFKLSQAELAKGGDLNHELRILVFWIDWYAKALRTTEKVEVGGSSPTTSKAISDSVAAVTEAGEKYIADLKTGQSLPPPAPAN